MIISSFLPRENKKQLANNRKALRCFISLGKFLYAGDFYSFLEGETWA